MASERLRGMIRDAARSAFTVVQAEHRGEQFYAFSLQTMSDATGVYAHANTEGGYHRAVERYREWKPEAVDERYCRWYWVEWAYRSLPAPGFDLIYLFLNPDAEPEWFEVAPSAVPRPVTDEEVSRLLVYPSMVAALGDLDREGVFGRGPDRDRVALFCSVEDSPVDVWVVEDSAARLNSAAAYGRCTVDGPAVLTRRGADAGDPDLMRMAEILDEWGYTRSRTERCTDRRDM